MSVLTPNIDSTRRIPLLPSSLMIVDTVKLRKKPRTADSKGIQKIPSIEKPRKIENKWYFKLSVIAVNKLSFADVPLKNNDR